MNRMHVADRPIPDPLAEIADGIERVALVAELGNHIVPVGRFHQLAHLKDGVRQRLFTVHVFAALNRGHCRDGMKMVRGGYHHGIDLLLHLVEHFPEIAVLFRLRKLFERLRRATQIDIAEGNDVVARSHGVDVTRAHSSDTNSGNIDFFYFIDYTELPIKDKPLLFHASYNIQSPTVASGRSGTLKTTEDPELTDPSKIWNKVTNQRTSGNYQLLQVNGYQGKYVGTILCVESHPDRKGKWYEGDDMFVIDDEPWPPRLHGTGTEDYFGMAWGFHRPYQAFDHGLSHFEKNITDHDRFFDGRYVTYRFHINDPILFYKSIHASIEAGHANECEQHYESVAIWYGKKIN